MYCKHCGKPINDASRFCNYCGSACGFSEEHIKKPLTSEPKSNFSAQEIISAVHFDNKILKFFISVSVFIFVFLVMYIPTNSWIKNEAWFDLSGFIYRELDEVWYVDDVPTSINGYDVVAYCPGNEYMIVPATFHGKPVVSLDRNNAVGSFEDIKYAYVSENLLYFHQILRRSHYLEYIDAAPDHPDYKAIDGILYSKNNDGTLSLFIYPNQKSDSVVSIPEEVSSISSNAFTMNRSNNALISLSFLGDIDEIPYETNIAAQNITFCGNVGSVGAKTFSGRSNLKTVVFQGDVSELCDGWGPGAFSDCESLTTVEFYGDVHEVGENVFSNCTSLNKVVFYGDVDKIDEGAFTGCDNLIIHCKKNSVPAKFAKKYDIHYEYI